MAKSAKYRPLECTHGEWQGSQPPKKLLRGDERRMAEHERKCRRGGGAFWHPGVLFTVCCCSGCGRRVA